MLRLLEQVLQFDKLDLQVQLPTLEYRYQQERAKKKKRVDRHSHKLFNGLIQPPRKKQRRLFVGIIVIRIDQSHRILGRIRVGRDKTRVQPTDIQTETTSSQSVQPRTYTNIQRVCAYSPSCLLSSLRASEGHQNRDTNPAHTTPTVTAVER